MFRREAAWSQQAYIKASNPDFTDFFGWSVALSGDGNLMVVGAVNEASAAVGIDGDQQDNSAPGAGAVYVLERAGGAWSQRSYLKASNTDSGDVFGNSIAMSGDALVVGAECESSAATGVDGDQADNSAPCAGAAYLFERGASGAWAQEAYLKASNPETFDTFGFSVAVSVSVIVVGANAESSGVPDDPADNSALFAGAAYTFERGASITPARYLKSPQPTALSQFGRSVAVDEDGNFVVTCQPFAAAGTCFVHE